MSTTKASSALLSRIAEAVLKELNRDDLYVAQAPAGMALGDAHLNLLQQLEMDRLGDPASVARLVEMSRIVDCIQTQTEMVTTPDQGPRYLSEVFPRLVKNVQFAAAPLSDGDQRNYEQALALLYEEPPFLKTPAYQEFCILRSNLEKKDLALTEIRLNLQRQESPEEQDALESELADLQELCTEMQEALEAMNHVHHFNEAEAVVAAAERRIDEVPASILTTLDTMELFEIAEPIPPNDKHVCCSFFPSHLSEDNWAPLKLSRADIQRGEDNGENATSNPEELDDSDIESIEVEIQTLVCERPWLWTPLFENQHWDWRSPSEPVSNGSADSGETELIPAYIHALIFARNLTVKGKTSAQSQVKLTAAMEFQPTANLLMRAINPVKDTSLLRPANPATRLLSVNPSLSASISTASAAPAVKRSTVIPALMLAHPSGPAVSRLPSVARPPVSSGAPSPVRPGTLQGFPSHMILRPGVIRPLIARGRVVDQEGNGIYQASVNLEGNSGSRSIRTGPDGGFTFPTINHGRYPVSVVKAGFETASGSITVPQATLQTITMKRTASCQVQVRLIEHGDGAEQPFTGAAKVHIQSTDYNRVESMDGRAEANFPLTPGDFNITVTSPESEQISPSSVRVSLRDGGQASQTLTFTVQPAPMLRNPDVQLLGFVCRRVPRCPNPK